MIKRIFNTALCTALLLTTVVMHADEPGTDMEDENGDIDASGLESPAPIDSGIMYLAVAGLAVAGYYFTNKSAVLSKK